MNNLCADIGWKSINHEGEQLCGDHVDIVEQNENSTVIYIIARCAGFVKGQLQKRWLPIVSTVGRDHMNLFEVLAGL